jgi:glycine cleavage system transcriptional repressor
MDDERYLVICALGADRPGLVADVTQYAKERGANIEDSRMSILGGEFGMLVLVSGGAASLARITEDVRTLEARAGLQVMVRPTKSPAEHRRAAVLPCLVVAEALDHHGIVHAVSAALHDLGINIVSLETLAYNAPVTGSPLFRLEARVDVPGGTTVSQVRQAMERVGRTENIDIEVKSLVRGG